MPPWRSVSPGTEAIKGERHSMTIWKANPPPHAGATLLHMPRLPEREPAENIARGSALAIAGIAVVLDEIEGELGWLQDDLPRLDDDDARLRGHYERKICSYERAICTLTEARRVLEGLAAELPCYARSRTHP